MSVNGNGNGLGWKLVGVLGGLLLSVLSWNATRELGRAESRIERLEDDADDARGSIRVLQTLRPEDRKLLDDLKAEQERQGKTIAAIAARLGVRE